MIIKFILFKIFVAGLAAGAAHAGLQQDPASRCAVAAPAYLAASSDYVFKYEGACSEGLAQGQGKAVWVLKNAATGKVTWEGAFSRGVYLPPPKGVLAARWLGNESALFDIGKLPVLPGLEATRLQVMAVGDLTNYPDPCKPRSLWVANAPAAALVQEDVAKKLLQSAVDKLKMHCGNVLNIKDKRGELRESIEVRVLPALDVALDKYNNAPDGVVSGFVHWVDSVAPDRFRNEAASAQRMAQQVALEQRGSQDAAQKLKAFFATHQAQGWADFGAIAQNPFRYANKVVVTAVQIGNVLSPTRALVSGVGRNSDDAGLLDGSGVAAWPAGSRLVAVKVLGRSNEASTQGAATLQLVGSEACKEGDCEDWLRLPTRLQDGQQL